MIQTWLCNTPLEAGFFLDLYIDLFNICIKKVNYFHFIYRSNKCLSLFGWSNKSLLYKGTFMFMIEFISYSLPSCLCMKKAISRDLHSSFQTERTDFWRNTIVANFFGILQILTTSVLNNNADIDYISIHSFLEKRER